MPKDREYCETELDFYNLAGSGGGKFSFPGFYEFDETTDKWLWCTSRSLTDEEFKEHVTRQTAMLDRMEVQIRKLRTDLLSLSAQARERGVDPDEEKPHTPKVVFGPTYSASRHIADVLSRPRIGKP